MTRKAISVLIAAVIAFSLLPAVSAFAASNGVARITGGGEVLPGLNQQFTLAVQGAERPANYIQLFYPTDLTGITANPLNPITPPSGWQAGYITQGAVNSVVFYGGSLAPGATLNLTVPGDVARPQDKDRTGNWRVFLSSNGGAQLTEAKVSPAPGSSLNTVVRILDTETIALVSPNGVLDKTGTERQPIAMRTSVRNYALSAVQVTPTLSASAGSSWVNDEQVTPGAPQTIPSGGSATFDHAVILGSAKQSTQGGGGTADKTTAFTADATAPGSNGFGNERLTDFVVQVAPTIALPSTANVSPRTFPARDVVTQATTTMPLRKSRTPAVNVTSGSMTFSNSTCTLASPVTFATGNAADGTLNWACSIEAFDGEESFPANVTLTGTDENDAPYSQTYAPMRDTRTPASTLSFTLDSLLPVVTLELALPRDADGNQQTALKKGDTVRITGTVDDAGADLTTLELRSNTGEQPATASPTIVDDFINGGYRFVANVTVPFDAPAGDVLAFASATDGAGWVGSAATPTFPLDNVKPLLSFGETRSTTDVESVVFEGDYKETLIRVDFSESNIVRGGCNPSQWKVDGAQVVVAVLFPDGDGDSWVACEKGQAAPNGSKSRLLLLGVPLDPNATPSVTYTPLPGDQIGDGAGNMAVQRVIDTVAGIAPPLPELIQVYRNTGTKASGEECAGTCEVAYNDEGKRWTRFTGNDLLVHVDRGAPGYTLQVLDATGAVVLASKAVATTSPSIRVPIGTTDGDYARKLRFVNARGILGEVLDLNIALDRVIPELASPVQVTNAGAKHQLKVPFSEKVVEGLDMAGNFQLYNEFEPGKYNTLGAPEEARRDPKPPFSQEYGYVVLTDGSGSAGQASFAGVGYILNPFIANNVRYGDRAGNKLADIGAPAAKPAPTGGLPL